MLLLLGFIGLFSQRSYAGIFVHLHKGFIYRVYGLVVNAQESAI